MTSDPADPVRQELPAGGGLTTSAEIAGGRVRYEVRTANPLYQERLEHMGYLRHGRERLVRDLSACGDVLAIHANFARHLQEMVRQSARAAPVRWEQALDVFLERTDGSGLSWFLYGSGALAVRGINIDPGDLDFYVSDAYLAGRLFADLLVEPVTEMTNWIADRGGRAFCGCLFEWLSAVHPDKALTLPSPPDPLTS